MERWIARALIAMAFAGFTSVIAKHGLDGISGELGLAVRTCFVFVFVLSVATFMVPRSEAGLAQRATFCGSDSPRSRLPYRGCSTTKRSKKAKFPPSP